MQTKLIYFHERISVSSSDVCALVQKFDRILEYDVVRIDHGLCFFESLDLNLVSLRKLFLRFPSLLFHTEANHEKKINSVKKMLDISNKQMTNILSNYSNWLSSSHRLIEKRVQFLSDLGMRRTEIRNCVIRHPHLLSYNIQAIIKRLRILMVSGFTYIETIQIVQRLVQIFSVNIVNNLEPTLSYLLNEVGLSHHTIVSTPTVISLSLNKRILPRHKSFLEMASPNTKFKIKYLLQKNDEFDKILKTEKWINYSESMQYPLKTNSSPLEKKTSRAITMKKNSSKFRDHSCYLKNMW